MFDMSIQMAQIICSVAIIIDLGVAAAVYLWIRQISLDEAEELIWAGVEDGGQSQMFLESYAADLLRGMNTNMNPQELVLVMVTIPIIVLLVCVFLNLSPLMIAGAVLVSLFVVPIYVANEKKKGRKSMNEQLGALMPLIATNLKSGVTIDNAFKLAADTATEPLKSELEKVFAEVAAGVPMDEALHNMADRNNSADIELLSVAISVQATKGGSLVDIVNEVGNIIRERQRVAKMIAAKTASVDSTTAILMAMPVLVVVGMFFVMADAREFYTTPAGIVCLIGAVIFLFGVKTISNKLKESVENA
jgi:Flp pilus assembly protein TadB